MIDDRNQCQKNGFHYCPNCDNCIPDPEALQAQLQAVTQERDWFKNAFELLRSGRVTPEFFKEES